MKFIFTLFALTGTTLAHNLVTHLHINGVPNSDCVRQVVSADPILDVGSTTMACNNIQGLAPKVCTVKAGDAIAFEWRVDRNIPAAEYPLKDGTIPVGVTDDSHKGPCSIYMKKVADAATAAGVGDGWFKVSEDGLDSNGVFCSDRLRLSNAPQPGVIPSNIEPGAYLLRAEMLTLNNAGPASLGGAEQPQFYVSCSQVIVEGSSGTNPATVSIPGYLTMGPPASPGLIFDIWNSPDGRFSGYTVPGPAPMSGGSGAPLVSPSKSSTAPAASQPTSSNVPAPVSTSTSESSVPTPDSGTPDMPAPDHTSKDVSAPSPTYEPGTPDSPAYTQSTSNDVPAPTPSPTSGPEVPVYGPDPGAPATSSPAHVGPGSPNTPTRVPNYTVTTATTLITITSTLAPGETSPGEETPASSEPTHSHGHGRHYGGRSHRRGYRAAS